MANVIKFESLEIDVLIGIANESAEQVETAAKKAVEHAERCGRALIAIKAKLPHGEWGGWLGQNFDYSQEHARRFMAIASNSTRVLNLKDATSIREALRMIADDPETPKRLGKPTGEVIEVEASGPEVAVELLPQQSFQVTTDPAVAETSSPTKAPAVLKPKAEPIVPQKSTKRSLPVDDIKLALMRMKASAKRRVEIIEVATLAWDAMNIEQKREFFSFAADKRQSLINREQWY